METIGGILALLLIVGFCCYGVIHEVKHIKAAIAKEQKQTQLYEALLQKLEEC